MDASDFNHPVTNEQSNLQDCFDIVESQYDLVSNFEDLNLRDSILHGISSIGFTSPSPIQRKAIKPAIDGRDVIAQAQSGTGKTAAYVIATLQNIDVESNAVQAIVLAPTRELARQICSVYNVIGSRMNVKCRAFIGGTNVREDIMSANSGIHIAIGTPGRIYHLVSENKLSVSRLKIFVLDEADEMLSAGFTAQIYQIYIELPDQIQVLLYSATLTDEAMNLTNRFMVNPVTILMKKEKLTLQGIRQNYILVEDSDAKVKSILDLCGTMSTHQVVIFMNATSYLDQLAEILDKHSFSVDRIHAKIPQHEREEIMLKFRKNEIRVLLATDLIARGIDVQNVSLVINFDMPKSVEVYLHRIGRSGRFGKTGHAISLITGNEKELINDIQNHYETHIPELSEDEIKR